MTLTGGDKPSNQNLAAFLTQLMAIAREQPLERPLFIHIRNTTAYAFPWQILTTSPEELPPAARARERFLGAIAAVSEDRVGTTPFRSNVKDVPDPIRLVITRWYTGPERGEEGVAVSEALEREDDTSRAVSQLLQIIEGPWMDHSGFDIFDISASNLRRAFHEDTENITALLLLGPGPLRRDHGRAGIWFSKENYLTPTQLREAVQSSTAGQLVQLSVAMLALYNPEHDVLLRGEDDFATTLLSLGASSVVAPVCEMWPAYSVHFTQSLAEPLRDGFSVQHAVHEVIVRDLEEDHNPAGLLFSLLGNPGARAR